MGRIPWRDLFGKSLLILKPSTPVLPVGEKKAYGKKFLKSLLQDDDHACAMIDATIVWAQAPKKKAYSSHWTLLFGFLAPKFMHCVMPHGNLVSFTLHKIRAMIERGGIQCLPIKSCDSDERV
ncbi:hypothetical protein P618_200811 [Holospora obtusa F1]|uniref:Uncharacterized protein n=1 Tax=Holospora obtusa F1 TaxID=1399147 RepID=W6TDC7_HOLOB|nr:hypothetical protein P618_200811 [Holospora obtusa F1]